MTHFSGAEFPTRSILNGTGIAMSKQAEFAVILKMNPMFADLGSDELSRISNLCHTQHLASGEVLFQKGDAGDALFGVRRGQVRIETGENKHKQKKKNNKKQKKK